MIVVILYYFSLLSLKKEKKRKKRKVKIKVKKIISNIFLYCLMFKKEKIKKYKIRVLSRL